MHAFAGAWVNEGELECMQHHARRGEAHQFLQARILALSEIPQLWARSLSAWRTANRKFKKRVNEVEAPDADEEYLLYQTLLGTWPIDIDGAEKRFGQRRPRRRREKGYQYDSQRVPDSM